MSDWTLHHGNPNQPALTEARLAWCWRSVERGKATEPALDEPVRLDVVLVGHFRRAYESPTLERPGIADWARGGGR